MKKEGGLGSSSDRLCVLGMGASRALREASLTTEANPPGWPRTVGAGGASLRLRLRAVHHRGWPPLLPLLPLPLLCLVRIRTSERLFGAWPLAPCAGASPADNVARPNPLSPEHCVGAAAAGHARQHHLAAEAGAQGRFEPLGRETNRRSGRAGPPKAPAALAAFGPTHQESK